jgi:arylsulfatase A-like enzyme
MGRKTVYHQMAAVWLFGLAAMSQNPSDLNMLLIGSDDLNDFEGVFAGHPQALTPHLDAQAASGVWFANARRYASICGSSRLSLWV